MTDRPTLSAAGRSINYAGGSMEWDVANNRPVDYSGEHGRIWDALKIEFGITEPDSYVPPDPVQTLVKNYGYARFGWVAGTGVVLKEISQNIGSVSRIAKGRYRIFDADDDAVELVGSAVGYCDANPLNLRVTSNTASYVEVRAVNAASASYDPAEVIVEINKVVMR